LPESVLFAMVGRVGDMVMVTPALRATLRKHPHAEIHLLTSADGRRVLHDYDPRIRHVFVYRRQGVGQIIHRLLLRRELAARRYDYSYCFDPRSTYRRLLDGVARHTHHMDGNVSLDVPFPLMCLRLVNNGANPGPDEWLSLSVKDEARVSARDVLRRAGIDEEHVVVGLHPSFYNSRVARFRHQHHARRKTWPIEAWAAFARGLDGWGRSSGRRLAVITDLMPEDRSLGEALVRESGDVVRLFTEPPDFDRYKATLDRMDLLVTPDTGPMHIAAALRTRLVALFSSDTPGRYTPYTDPQRYEIVRAEDPSGLEQITPERLLDVAVRQLEKLES
jgi:ADP-heptose:LPS heptosyltransferase